MELDRNFIASHMCRERTGRYSYAPSDRSTFNIQTQGSARPSPAEENMRARHCRHATRLFMTLRSDQLLRSFRATHIFYCRTQGSAKPPPWAILGRSFAAKTPTVQNPTGSWAILCRGFTAKDSHR